MLLASEWVWKKVQGGPRMRNRRILGIKTGVWLAAVGLLLVAGTVSGVACDGQAGRGPFTISGVVRDEAGRPVPGLRLRWLPALPGGLHPDVENIYWAIQGRPNPEVETDAAGRFVLGDLQDYFAVSTQEYLVWGSDVLAGRNLFWRVTGGRVTLVRTPPGEIELDLTARPAGALRLIVNTRDGRPVEGPLALAFGRSERPGEDELLVLTGRFAGGAYVQGGLEPGPVWVRVLAAPRAEEVKLRNYLLAAQELPGEPPPLVTGGDVRLQAQGHVAAGEIREMRLTLP